MAQGDDVNTSYASLYIIAARQRIIALFSGVFVVIMNTAITMAVRYLSFYERWHSRSDREKWHVVKLSVFYLVNSFLIPVLATSLSGAQNTW